MLPEQKQTNLWCKFPQGGNQFRWTTLPFPRYAPSKFVLFFCSFLLQQFFKLLLLTCALLNCLKVLALYIYLLVVKQRWVVSDAQNSICNLCYSYRFSHWLERLAKNQLSAKLNFREMPLENNLARTTEIPKPNFSKIARWIFAFAFIIEVPLISDRRAKKNEFKSAAIVD